MPRELNGEERRVLLSLFQRGPAMPVELAAQCYSFPDQVTPTLKLLEQAGLVEMRSITRGGIGGSLVYLSERGRYRVRHELLAGDR